VVSVQNANSQILTFKSLLTPVQSAYKKFFSTETAVLKVLYDISEVADKFL